VARERFDQGIELGGRRRGIRESARGPRDLGRVRLDLRPDLELDLRPAALRGPAVVEARARAEAAVALGDVECDLGERVGADAVGVGDAADRERPAVGVLADLDAAPLGRGVAPRDRREAQLPLRAEQARLDPVGPIAAVAEQAAGHDEPHRVRARDVDVEVDEAAQDDAARPGELRAAAVAVGQLRGELVVAPDRLVVVADPPGGEGARVFGSAEGQFEHGIARLPRIHECEGVQRTEACRRR
jgi:hypothetical protein